MSFLKLWSTSAPVPHHFSPHRRNICLRISLRRPRRLTTSGIRPLHSGARSIRPLFPLVSLGNGRKLGRSGDCYGGNDRDDLLSGGGGGGGGGGEEGGNAGSGDDEHASLKELLIRILPKPKHESASLGLDAAKILHVLADYSARVLCLLKSTTEGAVLSVLGIVIEDNLQCPSPCDSSSTMSTENLRCPSSFDVASSRIDASISIDVEGRRSSYNYNSESGSAWNRFSLFANHLTNWVRRMAPAGSPRNNPDVNRMRGLLGSLYTITEKLFIFCGGLMIWSLQYPLGPKARRSFDDPGMQGIITASFVIFFISCILAPIASYLKESESIQDAGIKIFKWLFLIMSLGLCADLSVILRLCADIEKSILWSLGIIGSIAIVLIWAWVFYVEVPQIETRYETENQMLHEMHVLSEPASSISRMPPV